MRKGGNSSGLPRGRIESVGGEHPAGGPYVVTGPRAAVTHMLPERTVIEPGHAVYFEVELLENVQHLQHHGAATRQLIGRDSIAAILSPQWCHGLRLVDGQVLAVEQRSVSLHVSIDIGGDSTAIEIFRTALGDPT